MHKHDFLHLWKKSVSFYSVKRAKIKCTHVLCFLFLQNLQLVPQTNLPVQLEKSTVSQWRGDVMDFQSVMTRVMKIVAPYAPHPNSSVRKDNVLMHICGVMEKLTAKINLMKWIVIVRFIFLTSWL